MKQNDIFKRQTKSIPSENERAHSFCYGMAALLRKRVTGHLFMLYNYGCHSANRYKSTHTKTKALDPKTCITATELRTPYRLSSPSLTKIFGISICDNGRGLWAYDLQSQLKLSFTSKTSEI